MQTKSFYRDEAWEAVLTHPQFTLGRRELEALVRFLPTLSQHLPRTLDLLHLGIGRGREIEHFVAALPGIATYAISDICLPVLERVIESAQEAFPQVSFMAAHRDIESPGAIVAMRAELDEPVLIVLVGNSMVFSNRSIDAQLCQALRPGDLFLVSAELPHKDMFESYSVEPLYSLLSGSGLEVHAGNTLIWYDEASQCLKMTCQGQTLLSAYKPSPKDLTKRMHAAGLAQVELQVYEDLKMIVGLFEAEE